MEKSFGIIPLKKKDIWKVFLVQLKSGGHWGFPKGHVRGGEGEKKTAERELKEETNLEIKRYISDKVFEENYFVIRNGKKIKKIVKYQIALVSNKPCLQTSEVLDGGWYGLRDAYLKITYPQSKEICLEVTNVLEYL